MTGIKIQFNGRQSEILPDQTVSGFDATVQNSMVCVGTVAGSDRMFPAKGTNLLPSALQGRLINRQLAIHETNYASVDTLFFINETDAEGAEERLAAVALQILNMTTEELQLEAQFTSSLGKTVGLLTTL